MPANPHRLRHVFGYDKTGGHRLFSYYDQSAPLAEITAADFFLPIAAKMAARDWIVAQGSDGGAFVRITNLDDGTIEVDAATGGGGGTPDTEDPVVSITAPAHLATVSGAAVTVSADATDDTGVEGVQFKKDGANLGSEVTTPPYSITWDTTLEADADYDLTAVARDAAGNTGTSAVVTVTVDNIAVEFLEVFSNTISAGTNGSAQTRGLDADGDGYIYAAGGSKPFVSPTITPGLDFRNSGGTGVGDAEPTFEYCAKYDVDGSLIWFSSNGDLNTYTRSYACTVSPDGAYVASCGRGGDNLPTTTGVIEETFTLPKSSSSALYGTQQPAITIRNTTTGALVACSYLPDESQAIIRDALWHQSTGGSRLYLAESNVRDVTGKAVGAGLGVNLYAITDHTLTAIGDVWGPNIDIGGGGNPCLAANATSDPDILYLAYYSPVTGSPIVGPSSYQSSFSPTGGGNQIWVGKFDITDPDNMTLLRSTYIGAGMTIGFETHHMAVLNNGNVVIATGGGEQAAMPITASGVGPHTAANQACSIFMLDANLENMLFCTSFGPNSSGLTSFFEGISYNETTGLMSMPGAVLGAGLPATDGSGWNGAATTRAPFTLLADPTNWTTTGFAASILDCRYLYEANQGPQQAGSRCSTFGLNGQQVVGGHYGHTAAGGGDGGGGRNYGFVWSAADTPVAPFDPMSIAWSHYFDFSVTANITDTAGAVTAVANPGTGDGLTATGALGTVTTGMDTMLGRNVLTFDDVTNSSLVMETTLAPSTSHTFVFVFEADPDRSGMAAAQQIRSTLAGGSPSVFLPRGQDGDAGINAWAMFVGGDYDSLYFDGAQVVTEWSRNQAFDITGDGNRHILIVRGTLESWATFSTLGYGTDGTNHHAFLGKMAFFGVTPDALTSGERSDLETYLAARFGVTLA